MHFGHFAPFLHITDSLRVTEIHFVINLSLTYLLPIYLHKLIHYLSLLIFKRLNLWLYITSTLPFPSGPDSELDPIGGAVRPEGARDVLVHGEAVVLRSMKKCRKNVEKTSFKLIYFIMTC